MSEVTYKLYPGIGDTILGRMVFQELLNSGKYQTIRYCLMQAETVAWRSDKFYKLALEWAEECLSLPGVIHEESNQHYENLSWWEIAEREQVFPAWNPLDPNIYNKKEFVAPCDEPYVCVLTKLRHVNKNRYESHFRNQYMELIKDISTKFKIVMFGEKEPGGTFENNLHKATIFSIYNDIKNAVPADRLVDQTLVGFHAVDGDNSLDKLHYDCQLLANSALTLSFGTGGGFVLAAVTSPRSLLYSIQDFNPRLERILNTMYQKTNRHCKWFTSNFGDFANEAKNTLNNISPSWVNHH